MRRTDANFELCTDIGGSILGGHGSISPTRFRSDDGVDGPEKIMETTAPGERQTWELDPENHDVEFAWNRGLRHCGRGESSQSSQPLLVKAADTLKGSRENLAASAFFQSTLGADCRSRYHHTDDRDTGTERRTRAKNKSRKQEAGHKKGGGRALGISGGRNILAISVSPCGELVRLVCLGRYGRRPPRRLTGTPSIFTQRRREAFTPIVIDSHQPTSSHLSVPPPENTRSTLTTRIDSGVIVARIRIRIRRWRRSGFCPPLPMPDVRGSAAICVQAQRVGKPGTVFFRRFIYSGAFIVSRHYTIRGMDGSVLGIGAGKHLTSPNRDHANYINTRAPEEYQIKARWRARTSASANSHRYGAEDLFENQNTTLRHEADVDTREMPVRIWLNLRYGNSAATTQWMSHIRNINPKSGYSGRSGTRVVGLYGYVDQG
ncbi:hypothetical protein C8R44DRAFT_740351 [Mycena epipterygia]|nr:hypothetical protein C8R44DRAFT_740351 [Mycena epipterygia]